MIKRLWLHTVRRWCVRRDARYVVHRATQLEHRLSCLLDEASLIEQEIVAIKRLVSLFEDEARIFKKDNDALRAEIDVIKNITLPESNLAHRLAMARYETDIALQVKRQAVL